MDRSKLPLVRVAIKDLTPLQRGLNSKTVQAKRELMQSGSPVDAPLVFKSGAKLYVADGHHTTEAAHLEGYTHVKARILKIGRLDTSGYEKPLKVSGKKKGKLLPKSSDDTAVADPFRKEVVEAERRLAVTIGKALRRAGRAIAEFVGQYIDEKPLKKANEPPPRPPGYTGTPRPGDPDYEVWIEWLTAEAMAAGFWTNVEAIEKALEVTMSSTATGAAEKVLAQLMPDKYDDLVDKVFDRAVNYSRIHAGELIGDNARGTGALAESTRKRIRAAITEGLEDNIGRRGIEQMLVDDFAFSEERAELIAGTEIGNANSFGSHEGLRRAQAAGVQVEHRWLCEEDACEICQANQEQGWIPLDEEFQSGDLHPLAHPNCRCAEEARAVEPAVKGRNLDLEGLASPSLSMQIPANLPGDGQQKELQT